MKKTILTAICCLAALLPLRAQEVVTGIVVDSKNNPVPGAKVETVDGSQSVITNLDGTFSIPLNEPAKKLHFIYSGMQGKTAKIKPDMKVKLRDYSRWKADKWRWFTNAVVAFPNKPGGDVFNPAYGLMIGGCKEIGFYLKGVTNTFGTDTYGYGVPYDNKVTKEKSTYWSATGGIMVRLASPIHLYYGLGYAEYKYFLKDTRNNWYEYDNRKVSTLAVDLGVMIRIKRINISLGLTLTPEDDDYYDYYDCQAADTKVAGNFGIGYSF